jgi:hypothetical protein
MGSTVLVNHMWKTRRTLDCRASVNETDPRHIQVVVRGGHYFFETRVFRRNGSDALRCLKFTELETLFPPYLRKLRPPKGELESDIAGVVSKMLSPLSPPPRIGCA